MRIVHIADPHLGYRAYNRVTPQGINRREDDVFKVFEAALAKTVEIAPDLIIIAGDLFHVARPSNMCIRDTFRALSELRGKLGAPIVIIGGNHDSPRSVDTGCILDLLSNIPDIHVVHNEYRSVNLPGLDTTVSCLCHRALPQATGHKLEPDAGSRHNILTLHGTIEGVTRNYLDTHTLRPADILSDAWDYVACGHYHIYDKLADNTYYSGSIEFTGTSIWQESETPKGFIEYDTHTRLPVFHQLETRTVVDMHPIDARDLSASQLSEMIAARIEGIEDGHAEKIIRLVVENLHREVQVDLDYAFIRQVKAEALHFELQCRPPQKNPDRATGAGGQTRPLEDEWREFVADGQLPGGVKRERLLDLGLSYLGAQEIEAE